MAARVEDLRCLWDVRLTVFCQMSVTELTPLLHRSPGHDLTHVFTELSVDLSELRKRAEAGSTVAQSILGVCYLDGIEVEADYSEAFRLLSSAAAKGAIRATAHLARMYAQGLGIPRDVSEATRL